jgi:hypothetical protein
MKSHFYVPYLSIVVQLFFFTSRAALIPSILVGLMHGLIFFFLNNTPGDHFLSMSEFVSYASVINIK